VAKQEDQIDGDFQHVFGGEEGERVLRYLMHHYWIFAGTLDPDPHKTAFNEGQRSIVLDILDRIRRKWEPHEFSDTLTQATVDYARGRPDTDPSAQGSA
jgi:hypothetical protein